MKRHNIFDKQTYITTQTYISALSDRILNINALNVFCRKKCLLEQNEEDKRNHCSAKPNINCILPQCD